MDTGRIHLSTASKKHTLISRIYITSESKKGKIFQRNGPKKQAGVAILISGKIDFQSKTNW